MTIILNSLNFVRTYLQYLIIGVIVLGLLNVYVCGGFDTPKSVLLIIVVFFVIYPVLINTKFSEIIGHLREPRPIFCSIALNFIISPLIAYGVGLTMLSDQPEFFAALILLSLIPTSAMSAAWTSFSGGSMATVLYLIPLNLLFAAFVGLPFILPVLIRDAVSIHHAAIMKNILLVFLIPLILGQITRVFIIRYKGAATYQRRIQPELGGISAMGILVLLFLVMSLKRNSILLHNYHLILTAVVPVILYYISLYVLSVVWARLLVRRKILSPEKAITIIYTSITRHVNISLALVLSAFPLAQASLMILLIVIAYIMQVPSMAFYAQHYGKKFVAAGPG